MSEGPTCGARDHAGLLAEALERRGVTCSMHWLWREERSLRGSAREVAGWARRLARELESARPDAVLLHYSVFPFAHRGIPLFAHRVLSALHDSGAPVVSVMHEFAYPWRAGDPRGNVWALTQRAALVEVVRSSRALLVTTEMRAEWFRSRRWLPRRTTALAPVFSNLPASTSTPPHGRARQTVGLFGYSYQGASITVVLDALQTLAERELELVLLGGPGSDSQAGAEWIAAASERRLGDRISFTGVLGAAELADALGTCEVLLFADTPGPSSRKGTLAGSLASGRPVLALDGPQRWREMLAAQAAEIVAPNAPALAEALARLIDDQPRRETLGRRGRAFAQRMGPDYSATVVAELIDEVLRAREDSQCSTAAP
jgi:glycosyltransferase involved in cell wall biosynthesis